MKTSCFFRCLQSILCVVVLLYSILILFVRIDDEENNSKVYSNHNQQSVTNWNPAGGNVEVTKTPGSSNATVVAYAVSLIKCGDKQSNDAGLVDAALVMRHSIHKISIRNPQSGSRYDYKMYAIVHKQAEQCSSLLSDAGFEVIVKESPIQPREIKGEYLRNNIHTEWCCGSDEFIKLYAYSLPEKIIVHTDIDFVFLQPMDDLYDAILYDKDSPQGKAARSKIPLERPGEDFPDKIDAFITRDWPQVIPGRKALYQAGFLVARQRPETLTEAIAVVQEGDFKEGFDLKNGWDAAGYGGFVGGKKFDCGLSNAILWLIFICLHKR